MPVGSACLHHDVGLMSPHKAPGLPEVTCQLSLVASCCSVVSQASPRACTRLASLVMLTHTCLPASVGRFFAFQLAKLGQQWRAEAASRMPEARGDIREIVGQPGAWCWCHDMPHMLRQPAPCAAAAGIGWLHGSSRGCCCQAGSGNLTCRAVLPASQGMPTPSTIGRRAMATGMCGLPRPMLAC